MPSGPMPRRTECRSNPSTRWFALRERRRGGPGINTVPCADMGSASRIERDSIQFYALSAHPVCAKRCLLLRFNTYAGLEDHSAYTVALCREIRQGGDARRAALPFALSSSAAERQFLDLSSG